MTVTTAKIQHSGGCRFEKSNSLTAIYEVWYGDARCPLDRADRQSFENLKQTRWQRPQF